MPWTPDPFTGGVVWRDLPDTSSALDAANLTQDQNAEAAYAVHNAQSVVNYFEGGQSAVVLALGTASPTGSPVGGQLAVRSDGTTSLQRPMAVSAAAWQADPSFTSAANTTALNNAITSAAVGFGQGATGQPGGVVAIPTGTYSINGPLLSVYGVSIKGVGGRGSTILKADAAAPAANWQAGTRSSFSAMLKWNGGDAWAHGVQVTDIQFDTSSVPGLSATWFEAPGEFFKLDNLRCDATAPTPRTVTDAQLTSGSATVTFTTSVVTEDDANAVVSAPSGVPASTKIDRPVWANNYAFPPTQNASSCVLNNPASLTVANASLTINRPTDVFVFDLARGAAATGMIGRLNGIGNSGALLRIMGMGNGTWNILELSGDSNGGGNLRITRGANGNFLNSGGFDPANVIVGHIKGENSTVNSVGGSLVTQMDPVVLLDRCGPLKVDIAGGSMTSSAASRDLVRIDYPYDLTQGQAGGGPSVSLGLEGTNWFNNGYANILRNSASGEVSAASASSGAHSYPLTLYGRDIRLLGGGQLVGAAVLALQSDALGRTQVLGTSTVKAPSLQQFVSVMDAPWGAKGDAAEVLDASITSGANVVSSPTAAWAIGQCVTLVGAGPNMQPGGSGTSTPGFLVGYVSAVSTTQATLVTTPGGSTPANASSTLSGTGRVRYGTDDSTAIQAAATACSTRGLKTGARICLNFPSGASFLYRQIVPKSNVMLSMYGSTHYLIDNGTHTSGTTTARGLWDLPPGVPYVLSGFEMRGGNFPGTGIEDAYQNILFAETAPTVSSTDVRIYDAQVTNWATSCWDVRGITRMWAIGNRVLTCCSATGTNCINFIGSGQAPAVPLSDFYAHDNYIENCSTECISVGWTGTTGTNSTRAIITGNNLHTVTNNPSGSTCISVELSTTQTGTGRDFVIANNVCRMQNVFNTGYVITVDVNPAANNNPWQLSRALVQGNTCHSEARGILICSSDTVVLGNYVYAAYGQGIYCLGVGTFTVTADESSSTTLSNVTGSQTGILNGSPLSGTGISPGSVLLSGAGTATWTMSKAATATATGVTGITVTSQIQHVRVEANILHGPNNMTWALLYCVGLRSSSLVNNTISNDTGAVTGGYSNGGIFMFHCGWCDALGNRVEYSMGYGINCDQSNDCNISRNTIFNPNEGNGASVAGISIGLHSGLGRCEGNIITDTRTTHTMYYGIIGGDPGIILLIGNEVRGAATAAYNGVWRQGSRNNISDTASAVSVLFTTSGTYTPPPTVSLLQFTLCGGGSGGGGGGAAGGASPVTTQVGGAGGTGAVPVQRAAPPPTSGAITVTVGAGGAGGPGGAVGSGANGNAGSQGVAGNTSSVSGAGMTTISAPGAQRGLNGAANSAATASASLPGSSQTGGGNASFGYMGGGGAATSTGGLAGGDSVMGGGAGGSGGGPSSATLGGLGGNAGGIGIGAAPVGAGGSGTAAGGNGASAAANSGGGGGGGGGGSWNGGTSGAGGTGGAGGSGYVLITVIV